MYHFSLPTGAKIELKELTGAEELILTDKILLKQGSAIDKLLANCVINLNKNSNVNEDSILDMLSVDRLATLVRLRQVSYGNIFDFESECLNYCGPFNVSVNLEELPENNCDFEKETTFILPKTGKSVVFIPLNGHMERQLASIKKPTIHSSMLVRCKSIDGEAITSSKFRKIPSSDLVALRKEMAKQDIGLDTVVSEKCPTCGKSQKIRLEEQTSFLYPNLAM